MHCSKTFIMVYVSLMTMTAGFVLTLSSWFAPPINSFVHAVRIIGPSTLIVGFIFMLLSCSLCAIKQGKCCNLCYYLIFMNKLGLKLPDEEVNKINIKGDKENIQAVKYSSIDDANQVISTLNHRNGKSHTAKLKSKSLQYRASSLCELAKCNSPSRKQKGYKQLKEEDAVSLSDAFLTGFCVNEDNLVTSGTPISHISSVREPLLNTVDGKLMERTDINYSMKYGCRETINTVNLTEKQYLFGNISPKNQCDRLKMSCNNSSCVSLHSQQSSVGSPFKYSKTGKTLASINNINECMCDCHASQNSSLSEYQVGNVSVNNQNSTALQNKNNSGIRHSSIQANNNFAGELQARNNNVDKNCEDNLKHLPNNLNNFNITDSTTL